MPEEANIARLDAFGALGRVPMESEDGGGV